jgi:L-malate glycosyltransferase
MLKVKILQIPSFLSVDGIIGSFFREQAEVMESEFETRVLYGSELLYGRKSLYTILSVFKKFFQFDTLVRTNIYYLFVYPQFTFLSSKLNLEIKKYFYASHFKKLQQKYSWKPAILHAQCTYDAGILSNYLSEISHIPYVITEHNLFLFSLYEKHKNTESKRALEGAQKVLVVSNDKARQILIHEINVKPIFIGNLVNENLFYFKGRVPETTFTITTVGHFHWLKDYETMFETIQILTRCSSRKILLNCLGFNGWGNDYTTQIKELALKYELTNINFYSTIKRECINEYYWASDVYVLTSIAEGFPVSVLEALACGRPVYATRCGGVEDVINSSNGVMVPVRDANTLAMHLLDLAEGRVTYDCLEISNSIIKKFGTAAFRDNLGKIYRSLIS